MNFRHCEGERRSNTVNNNEFRLTQFSPGAGFYAIAKEFLTRTYRSVICLLPFFKD